MPGTAPDGAVHPELAAYYATLHGWLTTSSSGNAASLREGLDSSSPGWREVLARHAAH